MHVSRKNAKLGSAGVFKTRPFPIFFGTFPLAQAPRLINIYTESPGHLILQLHIQANHM